VCDTFILLRIIQDEGSDENAHHRVLSSIDKHLSTDDRDICEGPLTLEECTEALKHLKLNKSPGMARLSIEFYRHFWPVIGIGYMEVGTSIYKSDTLSLSQQTGVVRLLYKKGERPNTSN
jgi:hypothetical protein